jgi:hypothetical protein
MARIEAVISHPITYKWPMKTGFARFTHAPVLHFIRQLAASMDKEGVPMFRKPSGFALRAGAVSTLFAALLSTSVLANEAPATGLGESWPNATDVSVSPHYHVYVFVRDGIRYIQVNDLNGTVRGAVAMADRVVLVLPVGVDAPYVTTQHVQLPVTRGETVYRDSATRITAAPTNTGAVQLNVVTPTDAATICTNPFNCPGVSPSGN